MSKTRSFSRRSWWLLRWLWWWRRRRRRRARIASLKFAMTIRGIIFVQIFQEQHWYLRFATRLKPKLEGRTEIEGKGKALLFASFCSAHHSVVTIQIRSKVPMKSRLFVRRFRLFFCRQMLAWRLKWNKLHAILITKREAENFANQHSMSFLSRRLLLHLRSRLEPNSL